MMSLRMTLHADGSRRPSLNPTDYIRTGHLPRESSLVTSIPLQSNNPHCSFQMGYPSQTSMAGFFDGSGPMCAWALNSPITKKFCILVQLVPCITYYSEEIVLKDLIGHVGGDLKRQRRETISLTLAKILGAGLPGAGTGIAALTLQENNYTALN